MNTRTRIANKNHDELACATTRTHNRHGLSKATTAAKRRANRSAKRAEARIAFRTEVANS